MARWWSSLFGDRRRRPKPQVTDEVLGQVGWNDDSACWEAHPVTLKNITISLGNDAEPHPELVERARQIVRAYDRFEKRIAAFLADEVKAREAEGDGLSQMAADEIRQLAIDQIALFPDRRSAEGMVFFKGPCDEERLYRCDLVNGEPRSLGCDT